MATILPAEDDAAIEAAIFALLDARRPGASICPSDAARALHRDAAAWRAAMPRVRETARRLARAGRLQITQRGAVLDPEGEIRGAIRLRRPPSNA